VVPLARRIHAKVDGAVEDASGKIDGGKGKIGTTRKGIEPCYSAKVARNGVTFWMLCNEANRWEQRLRNLESAYRKTVVGIRAEND
jgi:adenylosuccinate synthase